MRFSRKELFWFGKLSSLKYAAQSAVTFALKSGKLQRGTHCETCGWKQPKHPRPWNCLNAHHDDYTKPLKVRWLCSSCHQRWHVLHGDTRHHARKAAKNNY